MIETKTEDYKSHKHSYNVYVEINTKTKLGQNLLEQYRKQAKKQYIDIGRIGYHDEYGRYIIDHYTLFELIAVPKLIISVQKTAVDKAGRDEYRLRTYMSKFGQLNFMLLVDRNSAELYLIEDVFIENLNHKENYETLLYKLRYSTREQVPLRQIFFKFGIKSNPDDYGKAFKTEAPINNIIVAKAKAEMTINLANQIASSVNQKALVTSLNFLNKEGTYGKNVTKEYSKKVSKTKELNELSSSPKLENTLNNVLVKTLEQHTTRSDVKDKTNFIVYKKVLDVELSSHSEVKKEVDRANTKQNLKEFLLNSYGKQRSSSQENEDEINKNKFETFEKIIEHKYTFKPNKETSKPIEEDFKTKDIVINTKEEFFDFNNKKVEINFNMDRFKAPEDNNKKLQNKLQAKILKRQEKKKTKLAKKISKNIKILNAECVLDDEFERSKQVLGILPNDSKKKKKKAIKMFFGEDNKKQKTKKEQKAINENQTYEETNKPSIIEKIEKQIRLQKDLKTNKEVKKINKKTIKNKKQNLNDTNQPLNSNKKKNKKSKENSSSNIFNFKTISSKITNTLNKKKKKKNQTDLLLDDSSNNKQNKKQIDGSFKQKTEQSALNSAKSQQSGKKIETTSQSVRTNFQLKQEEPSQEVSEKIKIKTRSTKEEIIKQHFAKNKQSENITIQTTVEQDKKPIRSSEHIVLKKEDKSTNLTQNVDSSYQQSSHKKSKKQEDLGQGM